MNTAKLKAAAEKARWGDWSAYKPHSGARGYEVRVGSEAVAQHCLKDDAAFIAEASPKAVLCLIAELESAQKRVAELKAKLETADRLQDSAFRHGLQHGFSFGQTDNQAGFNEALSAYGSRGKQ
ncbi:ead/Ea22-like family protein [Cronobacter malonaticus]|uniref:ead/Ea22-like family protein n=1 Tax=Cronobacter malonaticus TaxID=413503 RepID=UPI000CFD673A|nr:ead/Ea22-like family protein [Cronobacter malonaticus]MDT3595651.1 ead/Ea22-like family protein [Cronobacter malonaticus]